MKLVGSGAILSSLIGTQLQKNTKLSIVEVLAETSEDGKWGKLHSEVSSRKVSFFFSSSFLSAHGNR